MFTLVRLIGLLPGLLQCLERADFAVHPDRGGANKGRWKAVGSKIGSAIQESLDHTVNFFWGNHGTIGSDTYDHISFCRFGSLVIAVQDVVRVTTEAGNTSIQAKLHNWIISRIASRSDKYLID